MHYLISIVISVLLVLLPTCYMFPCKSVSQQSAMQNVGEEGEYFEGDMIMSEEQIQQLLTSKNGVIDEIYRWPDAVLVYQIVDEFTPAQLETINQAMALISSKSCIQFRRRSNEENFVSIRRPKFGGCNSYIGMQGGEQFVNYQFWCLMSGPGSPAHELLHALGFHHEQSSPDRDDYITINWDNIDSEAHKHNFEKFGTDSVTTFGVGYDYDSLMHYGPHAFGKDLAETITVKQPGAVIGQRDHISDKDFEKLNKMYNCQK